MKKFLLNIGLIFLIIYIPTFISVQFFPLSIFDSDYIIFQHQMEVAKEKNTSDNANVLILGDSRPASSVNPLLQDQWLSLCVVGSTPVENYYYLKHYLENHPKPNTVYFSFSIFNLTGYNEEIFWKRGIGWNIYTFDEFKEIINEAKKYDPAFFDNHQSPYLEYVLYKMNFPLFYISNIINSGYQRKQQNMMVKDIITKNRGHINLIWGKTDSAGIAIEAKFNQYKAEGINYHYFEKLFALCSENGIGEVYFENIPFNQETFINLKDQYVKDYKQMIANLSIKYPEYHISDSIFYYKNEYYGDGHHMNNEGARLYTEYLETKFNDKSKL